MDQHRSADGTVLRMVITGAGGLLGHDLRHVLSQRPEFAVTALSRSELDITDPSAVTAAVLDADVVINLAAWTDVAAAEADEAAATAVNGEGPARLAAACAAHGARLIQVSTDYVFPGDATRPYREGAATAPLNAYGRSKLAGERAVSSLLPRHGYIVRTGWLYGERGRCFPATLLRRAADGAGLDVVDDQHGQPTWARALAVRLVELAGRAHDGRAPAGLYHGTAAGQATWYDLARAVLAECGLDPGRVRRVRSSPGGVRRPAYAVLGHGRWAAAGLAPMAQWRPMLHEAVAQCRDSWLGVCLTELS
jgi:dTDP-4-dehydrorhamnose reductase